MNLKKYIVGDEFFDTTSVTIEVDHDKLTEAVAEEINSFWGGAEHRQSKEDDDVVRAAIRLFGAHAIRMLLIGGGATFHDNSEPERLWNLDFRAAEGWGAEDGSKHGWCGMRVTAAEVEILGYDDLELEEV
jgi:hypothetical protein